LGIGLFIGSYQGLTRQWLRWFDRDGNWIPTPTEKGQQRADFERQRVQQMQQKAEQAEAENQRLRELLRQAGIEIPDDSI